MIETSSTVLPNSSPPKWMIAAIGISWLALPAMTFLMLGSWDEAGKLGDSFGVVTSLFTGLALLGVVYTIWQQRLESQAIENVRTREQKFATQQIYQLALSTQLQSARALISEHRRAIAQLNPAIGDVPIAIGQLSALIESIKIDSISNAALRKHQPELIERIQELIQLQNEINRVRSHIRQANEDGVGQI